MENPVHPDSIIEALSIDCVIFGFKDGRLDILLVKHAEGISAGKWALPGGWITYGESVDDAAKRLLKSLTGISDIYLEQLKAFGDPNRYPLKRVVTVAYYALVNEESYSLIPGFTASDAQWFNVHEVPELIYDHNQILEFGYNHLKHKVRHEPIGFNLLPAKFTLLQLQELYEAILETRLDKSNFRRKLGKMKLLINCKEKQKDVSHRAAALFKFDKRIYVTLRRNGMVFEL
ncbi:MAG: DNA mismatch repair protein MutT [Bacteroidota bacterium]|nr:MAG: DNA mismatch repair protein MutT [Bacteroidota bacterium]HNR75293.1 NUDIX domain-containing protein [Cyclobacteriaceae bacterium]HNU42323.1 NUDIX domain-containing protein [Cyclobacteriaceae bacterium]